VQRTSTEGYDYFHKVVDCQWACPAHTPVPEYIRLIAEGRYADAYMVNWKSNVFPGILGRTCDRPCEPACRRGRVEDEPVAICRLKRVAADNKEDITGRLPVPSAVANGKRIALVGAGPASLTVARDLAVLGYGLTRLRWRGQVGRHDPQPDPPASACPRSVIDEEVGYITGPGHGASPGRAGGQPEGSCSQKTTTQSSSAAAPRAGATWTFPAARRPPPTSISASSGCRRSFGHIDKIGRRVIVLGGGNTAMDCCRTARRLGGET
jgi:formate dehydrogenase beta subunit